MSRVAATIAGLMIAGVIVLAQKPATPLSSGTLAVQQLADEGGPRISILAQSIGPNAPLPIVYSDYGEKISPALRWTGVPETAKSVALIMEDPDAGEPKPFVHWLLYNLPVSVTALPEALPGLPRLPELQGALQGRNSKGTIGYFGPRPPKGDPTHHYHFQIFAADEMLPLQASASREALLAALQGRVVASGSLVATFQAPPDAR